MFTRGQGKLLSMRSLLFSFISSLSLESIEVFNWHVMHGSLGSYVYAFEVFDGASFVGADNVRNLLCLCAKISDKYDGC